MKTSFFGLLRLSCRFAALGSAWLFLFSSSLLPAADSTLGVIAGSVSNAGTGDRLEGVRVSLPSVGAAALTDNTGHYMLSDVPPGTHEILVTYTGLDPAKQQVIVAAGQRLSRDFSGVRGVDRARTYPPAELLRGAQVKTPDSALQPAGPKSTKSCLNLAPFGQPVPLVSWPFALLFSCDRRRLDDFGRTYVH